MTIKEILLVVLLGGPIMVACVPGYKLAQGERIDRQLILGRNSPSTVGPFQGRILSKSPILIHPNAQPEDDLFRFISSRPVFIVDKSILEYDCDFQWGIGHYNQLAQCMSVQQNEVTEQTVSGNGKWAYPPESKEFLEVNAFYHTRNAIAEFFRLQRKSIDASLANADGSSSIPYDMRDKLLVTQPFWYHSGQTSPTLKIYSNCLWPGRPFFLFASLEVCLGEHEQVSNLNFSEDPSIIHHEVGHFFSTVLFNQRNVAAAPLGLLLDRRASFGGNGYSEVDLISEGLADWFAHNQTGRTEVFEWAGGFTQNDRPVTESSPLHALNDLGISPDIKDRPFYPDFINYYHYDPGNYLTEDVQQAGMIISHFLVALGREIASTCRVSNSRSRELVFYLIQETLNELGDLTSKGKDSSFTDTINMTQFASDTWAYLYTAPNPRLFAQKMGKHFLRVINGKTACNGVIFGQDKLEQLIDSYGLLLFRTYNENGNCDVDISPTGGNGVADCREGVNTSILAANRRKSTLLSKSALQLDDREGRPLNGVFLFDHRTEIKQRLNALKAAGLIYQDLDHSDLVNPDNNNNNQKITPGEVIGIALNLFNNSNMPMGGVQVLANDWDHIKVENGISKMCNNFADGFPALSEGGASPDILPLDDGDCGYITRENGQQENNEKEETIAPICFILYHDANETRWINQQEYREKVAGHNFDCLNKDEPLACYFRAIPGADQAWYSKLNPRSNWQETYSKSTYFTEEGNLFQFAGSNIMLFEVSRHLPPGTQVNCRFRARFTNCDECWHDPAGNGDDYLDFEFAGNRPYRIFNVVLTVLD